MNENTTEKAEPKFHWKDRPRGKNDPFFHRLKMMPSLPHWPNHDIPFSWERSPVIQFIFSLEPDLHIKRVISLFDMAKKKKVIVFDAERNRWSGNGNWNGTK